MSYADDTYWDNFEDNHLDGFWSGLKKVGKFVGKKALPFVPVVGGVAAAGVEALEQRSANKKQAAAEQAAQLQAQQQAAQAAIVQAQQQAAQPAMQAPQGGDNTMLYVGGGLALMMFFMMMSKK